MSLFKKRKMSTGGKKKHTEEGDIEDDDETQIVKSESSKSKAAEVMTSKSTNKTAENVIQQVSNTFDSSGSAIASGKVDQGAAIDTSNDIAQRISGTRAGPVKSASNLRISCRFDYQPDVCKDYKDSGYCGYGDSCKFLHDRGDYKTGWQLEREYDDVQKKKQQKLEGKNKGINNNGSEKLNDDDDDLGEYYIGSDDEDDGLPFVCLKCKNSFVNPVVTKCKHYFCERCAVDHFKKDKRCFVCKEQTEGSFKVATEIVKKLKKHQEAS